MSSLLHDTPPFYLPLRYFFLFYFLATHTPSSSYARSSFSWTTPLFPYEHLHPSSLSLFILHLSSRATILRTRPWLSPAFRGQTRFSLSQLSQQHDLGGGSVPAPSCGSPGVAGRGEGKSPASRTKGFKIRLAVVEKPEVVTERSYLVGHTTALSKRIPGARSRRVDEIGLVLRRSWS